MPICVCCGTEFVVPVRRGAHQKYCGLACRIASQKRRPRTKPDYPPRQCKQCQTTFKPTRSTNRYCSDDCRLRWHWHKINPGKNYTDRTRYGKSDPVKVEPEPEPVKPVLTESIKPIKPDNQQDEPEPFSFLSGLYPMLSVLFNHPNYRHLVGR